MPDSGRVEPNLNIPLDNSPKCIKIIQKGFAEIFLLEYPMASAERQLTRKARIAAASAALVALLDKPQRVIPTCGGISKSKFVAGLQCAKRLFLQVHQPYLAKLTDQANKDQGTAVGVLARKLFRGGVLVDADRNQLAEAAASAAMVSLTRSPDALSGRVGNTSSSARRRTFFPAIRSSPRATLTVTGYPPPCLPCLT